MSPIPVSRTVTLADVIQAIDSADATRRRREDLASAVRTVARVLGRRPDEIPADPRALAVRLNGVAPRAQGISRDRWNNIRSLLRAALALVRPMMAGRLTAALSPAWLALYERLQTKSERYRLSPLLRWLSETGVEPGAATPDHLERFRGRLMTASLRRKPEEGWSHTVWAWNHSIARVDGWPNVVIKRDSRKVTYTRPWSAFPSSLKADVDGWLDRLAGRDIAADGPARPARPSTLATRQYQLRAAVSALVLRGRAPESINSLADLVAPAAFVETLKFFYERNGSNRSSTVHGMAGMLIGVARHWVHCDETVLAQLKAVARRLAVPDTGLTAKNRERLRPFDDPEIVAAFVNLPFKIKAELGRRRLSPLRAALLAQMAAAIALLLMAPVRRGNLVAIEIGRHLLKVGRKCHLVIAADEVKNEVDLEFEIPDEVVEIVDWYIREHRPVFLRGPSNALFPGKGGKPKSGNTLGQQIKATVFREIGLHVNPHLFRHIGAKMFLDEKPGSHEDLRRVLAHKKMDTTTRFYAGAETKAATRRFDEVILGLRRKQLETIKPPKKPTRPQEPGGGELQK